MAPDAVGTGTLRRLSQLPATACPVLSVYLDLDRSQRRGVAGDAQLGALLRELRHPAERDVARVEDLVRANPALLHDAPGLAIFSSAGSGILEAVRLPIAVRPMAVLDTMPWLEPLAELVTQENWGIAIVSPTTVRLFRGGPRGLYEFVTVDDRLGDRPARRVSHHGVAPGTRSGVAAHVRWVADRLLRAHRRRPFTHLAIVAPLDLRALIEASLDEQLNAVQAGVIAADLEEASPVEIARVVAPLIEGVERAQERALLTARDHALEGQGAAVEGCDEVLAALEQRRVEVLLIAHGSGLIAGRCPLCGRTSTTAGRCTRDGAPLVPVDAVQHATGLASDQAAEVVIVRHEHSELAARGSIAALLRDTRSSRTVPPPAPDHGVVDVG